MEVLGGMIRVHKRVALITAFIYAGKIKSAVKDPAATPVLVRPAIPISAV